MKTRLMLIGCGLLTAALGWTTLTTSSAAAPGPMQTRDRENYNSGAYLYRAFCASCHGETGRGDGPAADLTTPRASDLTVLQRRAGGTYPRARVRGVLDGSLRLPGHDGSAMPDWSRVLRKIEGDDERVLQQRLDALVEHLGTLQVP
jgi:mono/diheme cytochrome c family protein